MIINKHEAVSTKAALQDIAKQFGDAVFIISNMRLEGRNVVYFATDAIAAQPEPKGPDSLQPEMPNVRQKKLPKPSGSPRARKARACKKKNAESSLPVQVHESKLQPLVDVASLSTQIDELKGLLADTTKAMIKADMATNSRFEYLEELQRKEKSGIDQVTRRLEHQTQLLGGSLSSMETRALPETVTGTTVRMTPPGRYPAETREANACHLLTYMKNNGSFYDSTAFSTGLHAVLTDFATGTGNAIEEFSSLLRDSATNTLPSIIRFGTDKTTPATRAKVETAADEVAVENFMANAGSRGPALIFVSTEDYLSSVRKFKCLARAQVHCFYSSSTALDQLARLEDLHRIRPRSLSITALPPPSRGLPEFFALMAAGLPVLFMAGDNLPLARPDAIMHAYVWNERGSTVVAKITAVLENLSAKVKLSISGKKPLQKLAGRNLNMAGTADA
jgi:hypothetical protein